MARRRRIRFEAQSFERYHHGAASRTKLTICIHETARRVYTLYAPSSVMPSAIIAEHSWLL
jgi:hypothetical protein